jgi:hypothetical protein
MLGVTRLQPPTPDQPHYRPMSQFKPLPPIQELQQAFAYDPDTGIFRHKHSRGRAARGSIAGSENTTGYVRISFQRKNLWAHRVAWFLMTGQDPLQREVDHKDRDGSHNWFSNLRLGTPLQNCGNRLAEGCYRTPSNTYQARICFEGRRICLGTYFTPEEAREVYIAKHIELHGTFSPYFQ